MHGEVEPAPAGADRFEHRFEFTRVLDVAGQDQRTVQRLCERSHDQFGLVVEIGRREFGAHRMHHLRAAVGDAVLVGNAQNQSPLACQQRVRQVVQCHRDGLLEAVCGAAYAPPRRAARATRSANQPASA